MKTETRFLLSIVLVTFLSINLTAQVFDSVYVKKNMLNYLSFYKGNQKISMRQIKTMAKGNEKAQIAIKKLRQVNTIAMVSAVPTGLAVGFGLGNVLNNSTNDLKYLLTGSGVMGFVNLLYLGKSIKPMYMQQIADGLNKPN